MAESLHFSPETIMTLLISYTPVQNEECKKIKSFSLSHTHTHTHSHTQINLASKNGLCG